MANHDLEWKKSCIAVGRKQIEESVKRGAVAKGP